MCAIQAVCVPPTPQVKNRDLEGHLIWRNQGWIAIAQNSSVGVSFLKMRRSLQLPIAPGKKLGALLCLLAVLLLWAPAWAAALQSHPMDCCAGGLCPAHGHHSKSSEPASQPTQSPVDCEHNGESQKSSGLAPCSLSCCPDSNHPTTAATIFVLPVATQISAPSITIASVAQPPLRDIARVSDPLSPPPRA